MSNENFEEDARRDQ